MRTTLRLLFFVSLALGLAGCPYYVRVPVGAVATPGLSIRAADGSFHIADGEPFATPFHVAADDIACGPYRRDLAPGDYPMALRAGARRVVVRHPDHSRPLHGVLMFCTVWEGDRTGATRWHRVAVPDDALAGTDGGVSLTFVRATFVDSEGYPGQVQWALWLSERPI
jgi:hypothetical protein